MKRNRQTYLLLTFLVIVLGVLSRRPWIPSFIYPYLGDVLYALMIYFLIASFFLKWKTATVLMVSISVCFIIEISQLYQSDWINSLREIRLVRMVLGVGFLWSDLVSYIVGAAIGYVMEYLMFKQTRNPI